ncbi:MAG: PEP-CTERM sorting domain-containing protein [Planctomycetaceae bacterium]|nr:PEP-CTERM sorting domain-containing protein [Planctomycetaceae bacterium]
MKKLICGLFVGLAVLLLPAVVQACLINYSVTITGSDGTNATFSTGEQRVDAGVEYTFDLVQRFDDLSNPDDWVDLDGGSSKIQKLALTINSDPEVGIEFGLRAGSLATTYNILSEVVVFDPIVNPTAYASAGVTLTDRPDAAGAAITGLFYGGKTHQARYNSTSVFANLVSGFSIPERTLTNEENKGTRDFPETILGTVSSIESEFWFTLSARDSASGTSTFVVVPEPATICLMGIAALAFLRKQR